jgi:hypothetical protein
MASPAGLMALQVLEERPVEYAVRLNRACGWNGLPQPTHSHLTKDYPALSWTKNTGRDGSRKTQIDTGS